VILNLQILPSFSLYLAQLRQSDAMIPIINFHWKDLSNQLDPSKYQRLVFGIILILMMIYRPTGILPAARRKRELEAHAEDAEGEEKGGRPWLTDSSSSRPAASSSASAGSWRSTR
jgi:branched-chain amino acid transport system permease protein